MPWTSVPRMMPITMLSIVIISPAMASPLTNFEAPSSEPKKVVSACSSSRRRFASVWSMAPADMSLSMASCLPGMPSRAKRAPTSAIRVAPLVMTMKLTIRSTQNTTRPRIRLPPMMNSAKPWITSPAAPVPLWPWPMISLVEETLSESRSISEARSTVGKAEKSSGRSMKRVTVKIRIASAKEAARPISSIQDGIGRTIMTMTAMSASASRIVGRNRVSRVRFIPAAPVAGPGRRGRALRAPAGRTPRAERRSRAGAPDLQGHAVRAGARPARGLEGTTDRHPQPSGNRRARQANPAARRIGRRSRGEGSRGGCRAACAGGRPRHRWTASRLPRERARGRGRRERAHHGLGP